jgi:hypothetical protein
MEKADLLPTECGREDQFQDSKIPNWLKFFRGLLGGPPRAKGALSSL